MPSRRTHESINLRPLLHWEWATEGRDARLHLHSVPRGYLIWDTTGERWINPDNFAQVVLASMVTSNGGRQWVGYTRASGDTRRRFVRGRGQSGSQIARQVEDWAVRRFKLFVPKPSDLFNRQYAGPVDGGGVRHTFEPSRTWVPSVYDLRLESTGQAWQDTGLRITVDVTTDAGYVRITDGDMQLDGRRFDDRRAVWSFLNAWVDDNTRLHSQPNVRLPQVAAVNRLHGGDFDRITQEHLETLPTPAGWAVGWH